MGQSFLSNGNVSAVGILQTPAGQLAVRTAEQSFELTLDTGETVSIMPGQKFVVTGEQASGFEVDAMKDKAQYVDADHDGRADDRRLLVNGEVIYQLDRTDNLGW